MNAAWKYSSVVKKDKHVYFIVDNLNKNIPKQDDIAYNISIPYQSRLGLSSVLDGNINEYFKVQIFINNSDDGIVKIEINESGIDYQNENNYLKLKDKTYKDVKDGDEIEILPNIKRKIKVTKPKDNMRGYITFELGKRK